MKSCKEMEARTLSLIKTLLFTAVITSAQVREQQPTPYNDNYTSLSDTMYENEYDLDPEPPKTLVDEPLLDQKVLDELFGSPGKTQALIDSFGFAGNPTYWQMDQFYYVIQNELNKKRDLIEEELRENVEEVLHQIQQKMDGLSQRNGRDKLFFDTLNRSRSLMDCAITRRSRNFDFHTIENSFILGAWQCNMSIPQLWWDLVQVDYSNKPCSLQGSLEVLIKIENAGRKKWLKGYSSQKELDNLKLDLLLTLSKREHRDYTQPFLCGEKQLSACETFTTILCSSDFQYDFVANIREKIKRGAFQRRPRTPAEMSVLLEVPKTLGDVANRLLNVPGKRSSQTAGNVAADMLHFYVDMIDVTIGNESIEAWRQAASNTTLRHFQRVLLDNEDFVGSTSASILEGRLHRYVIDKETISLKMEKFYELRSHQSRVNFDFGNVQIWTESLTNTNTKGLNVYALYYKSWRDILRRILGGRALHPNLMEAWSNTSSSNSSLGRSFVGTGGIVSLSTQDRKKKISVPVIYKIMFDESDVAVNENGKVSRRCLSCAFLDVNTTEWISTGCVVMSADDVGVTCRCNHTTNFAAFMSPYEIEYDITEDQRKWLSLLEYLGSCISAICLFLAFVVFCLVKNIVRNERLKAHMNLAAALFFVHLIQLWAEAAVNNNTLCVLVTLSTHYFLLSAFMWMLIEGILLYFYVVQVFMLARVENNRWMYLLGWVLPMFIVAISAACGLPKESYVQPRRQEPYETTSCGEGQMLYPPIDNDGSFTSTDLKYSLCWLDNTSGMTWSFIVPALLVIVINAVILCRVVIVLVKLSKRRKQMKNFQTYSSNSYKSKERMSLQDKRGEGKSRGKIKSPSNEESSFLGESPDDHVITQATASTHRSNFRAFSQQHSVPGSHGNVKVKEGNFVENAKTAVRGAFVLFPLLGIPWVIGILGYKSYALTLVFVLLNSTQGLAFFLVHCVFNKEVIKALQRRLEVRKLRHGSSSRGRITSTSSLKSGSKRSL